MARHTLAVRVVEGDAPARQAVMRNALVPVVRVEPRNPNRQGRRCENQRHTLVQYINAATPRHADTPTTRYGAHGARRTRAAVCVRAPRTEE